MAREFDGAEGTLVVDGASVPEMAQGGVFTVSAWIYPDTVGEGSAGRIFDRRVSDYTLGATTNPLVAFYTTGTASIGFLNGDSSGAVKAQQVGNSNSITLGQWQHVLVTYTDSGDRKGHIYVNGTEVSYATDTAATGTLGTFGSNGDMTIGNYSEIRTFDGRLAEIAVYSEVLSAGDIASLAAANSPLLVRPSKLTNYWPMDGRGGSSAGELDWVTGLVTGNPQTTKPTVVDHPRIIYPGRRAIWLPTAGGASQITGTAALAFTAAATGIKGKTTGTAAVALTAAATGIKAVTTGTAALAVTASAAVKALTTGTAGIVLSAAATGIKAKVAGTASVEFTAAGTLTNGASGQITGTAALAVTAAATGIKAKVAGTAAAAFTAGGVLEDAAAADQITGTALLAFTAAATGIKGKITGTAPLSLVVAAGLRNSALVLGHAATGANAATRRGRPPQLSTRTRPPSAGRRRVN
jgi:hypothetical protein